MSRRASVLYRVRERSKGASQSMMCVLLRHNLANRDTRRERTSAGQYRAK